MTLVAKRINGSTTYHYRSDSRTVAGGKVIIVETDNQKILNELIKKQRGELNANDNGGKSRR